MRARARRSACSTKLTDAEREEHDSMMVQFFADPTEEDRPPGMRPKPLVEEKAREATPQNQFHAPLHLEKVD